MNRPAILLAVMLLAVAAIQSCGNSSDKVKEERQSPLAVAENSNDFNQSFGRMLDSYYSLKDAFVASDTTKVNDASKTLKTSTDSLNLNDIKGDSTGAVKETARSFATTISSSASAIMGEKDLEAKRKELNVITDALWSLTRTVKFDGGKVYYQFCPMAFKNQGAYWLSSNRQIRNPYFGDKMLTCGETADSVDYSKR